MYVKTKKNKFLKKMSALFNKFKNKIIKKKSVNNQENETQVQMESEFSKLNLKSFPNFQSSNHN